MTFYCRGHQFGVGVGIGEERPTVLASHNFNADEFYHLVYVYYRDEGKIELYANGVLLKTETGLDMLVGENFLEIGSWATNYQDYGDEITVDDVRIYDHALSKGEIKELAQGLTAHFKFDGDLHDCAQGTVGQYLGTNETYIEGKFGEQALGNIEGVEVDINLPETGFTLAC